MIIRAKHEDNRWYHMSFYIKYFDEKFIWIVYGIFLFILKRVNVDVVEFYVVVLFIFVL